MASFNDPTNTSLYTSVLSTLRSLIASCIKLDPSSDTDIPTNAMRHGSASSNKFQKWNGSSWADATVHFGNSVGIGTTSPSYQLHVSGTTHQTIVAENTSATQMAYMGTSGTGYASFGSTNASVRLVSNNTPILYATGQEVFIAGVTDQGAYNLQVAGTGVWGAGAYVNGSDARIKEEINPIDSGLDVVSKLNPVTFRYKEEWSRDRRVQSGFIAQELQTALSDKPYLEGLVNEGGEYLSVAYQNLIPILTKAIQELKAKTDELEARVTALESNMTGSENGT